MKFIVEFIHAVSCLFKSFNKQVPIEGKYKSDDDEDSFSSKTIPKDHSYSYKVYSNKYINYFDKPSVQECTTSVASPYVSGCFNDTMMVKSDLIHSLVIDKSELLYLKWMYRRLIADFDSLDEIVHDMSYIKYLQSVYEKETRNSVPMNYLII